MQQLFKDKILNEEYAREGFVKIQFAKTGVLQSLQQLFCQYCPLANHAGGQVFYSIFSNSTETNLQLKQEIKNCLQESCQNIFENHNSFFEMFLAKQPGNEPLALHQDWSYIYESETPVATVWLPLENTTRQNGTLFVIPKSHRFFQNYRSGSLPATRIQLTDELYKHIKTIELNEGESVVFHPAIFHGSHPNQSNQNRIVAAGIILPQSEEPIYFHQASGTNLVQTCPLSERHFFEHLQSLSQGRIFADAQLSPPVIYNHRNISPQQLLSAITHA